MKLRPAVVLLLLVASSGCATIQQVLALRTVDFSVDRVEAPRLAGVDLTRVSGFGDLGVLDAARLANAVTQRDLRLDFDLVLLAENPADNGTDARLIRMDWALFLQGRETVQGTFADETVLRPGQPTDVPIGVSLNLIDFFEGNAQDLFELALSLASQGGSPKEITVEATPIVDTALGPMRYPGPITIVSREIGQ